MSTILWIIIFGILMSAIALIGSLTFFIREQVWRKMILPLVAFAAGALIGGAFFHMIPAAVEQMGNSTALYCWLAGGYILFYILEEFLHWHHSHTHAHHDHAHHHHHHDECSHHNHELQHNHECPLVVCPNSCIPIDQCANKITRHHKVNANRTETMPKQKTVIEGVTVVGGDNDKKQTENINHDDSSTTASLQNTSSCIDIHSSAAYCDHHPHDLEEGNHIIQNNQEKSKILGPNHLPAQPAVLQGDGSATNNGYNIQHDDITSHQMTPVIAYLIIIADAVHNFLGGLFVGASFVDSISLGISAWIAAAAHEIPQELGDFAVLSHGGWSKQKALFFNFLSALTFPLGGIIAFAASKHIEVSFLIPFAAGNFLYIGGSDLIPEVKHSHGTRQNFIHFVSCSVGVGLMLLIRILLHGW